jgi:hypothetical protein
MRGRKDKQERLPSPEEDEDDDDFVIDELPDSSEGSDADAGSDSSAADEPLYEPEGKPCLHMHAGPRHGQHDTMMALCAVQVICWGWFRKGQVILPPASAQLPLAQQ